MQRIAANAFFPSFGHPLVETPDGRMAFEGADHHGWFLCGPYAAVENGVYRIKALAQVDGPPEHQSYFDVFDWTAEGRIYAARLFHDAPEVYVRLYASPYLELRFRTHGERLSVGGAEIEPLLLDTDPGDPERLRSLLNTLIAARAEPAAVFMVLDRLAAWGLAEEAERRRADYVAGAVSVATETRARLAWLHRGRGPSVPPSARALDREGVESAVGALPFTTYDIHAPTPEFDEGLRRFGYQPRFLFATRFHRDYDEPRRAWREQPQTGRTGVYPPRQPLFERHPDIERSFQASVLRGQGVAAYCPVSGEPLRSRHGFLIIHAQLPFTFYRFDGAEPFYLCTGANSNLKLFVYLPRKDVIVWLTESVYQHYSAELLVRRLLINLAEFAEESAAYLDSETRPAAVLGQDNYGHFFWTSLTGLQYAVDSGLHERIEQVLTVPTRFAPVAEVFPELAHLPTYHLTEEAQAFRHVLAHRLTPVHLTDWSMSDGFVARLRSLARSRGEEPPSETPRPLIWINLRAHNKIWRNQVEGYAQILNGLYDEHGSLSVLLDGVPDCQDLADGVRARARPGIVFHDGLSFDLWSKLRWGGELDAFIGVVGTGLIIVNSMAGAAGVAHADREHLQQLKFWRTIHPGSPEVLAPSIDQIEEFGEGFQRDYDLDWRILLDLVRQVLARS